ncbi:queuine tRNA-ribosyltransferase [Rickettsiales bacterium]|nr:queuine tRNA-ribosyltransferase [Rickettsiales bacterium]
MYTNFFFRVKHKYKKSRITEITTPHGTIQTPAFIFCATKAAIKVASPQQMKDAGTQIILANTYHLMLRPGGKLIQNMGGLHNFMSWDGPMLTDSGGFQIFSLGHGSVAAEIKGSRTKHSKTLLKIDEEGAVFKSYIDGRIHLLSPEKSIEMQHQLGADLILPLDECTPFHVEKNYVEASMEMSNRWATRSLKAFKSFNTAKQALYGIVQGGIYPDLRKTSCDFVNEQEFFGSAIGGSLGANKEQMQEIVAHATENLSPDRPIHLLGIGGIKDIFASVKLGIDTFDCVSPTRIARHGSALTKSKYLDGKSNHINLRNSVFRLDKSPIEPDCRCTTCQNFSKAYLHHLLKAKELLAYNLIAIHNITFMNKLLQAIRTAIKENRIDKEEQEW